MPYEGSYMWELRQKVGDMRLLSAGAGTIIANSDNQICMVYHRNFDSWVCPGGSAEPGQSWAEIAAREILEEAALIVDPLDLIPFASMSGAGYIHQFADGSTQPFDLIFTTKKFQSSTTAIDGGEISAVKWVSLDEAKRLKLTTEMKLILAAYETYLATGEFRQIVIEEQP